MVYTIDVLKTNVAEALEVLADSVLNPKFNPWEVKDQVAKMENDLKNMKTNPQTVLLEVSPWLLQAASQQPALDCLSNTAYSAYTTRHSAGSLHAPSMTSGQLTPSMCTCTNVCCQAPCSCLRPVEHRRLANRSGIVSATLAHCSVARIEAAAFKGASMLTLMPAAWSRLCSQADCPRGAFTWLNSSCYCSQQPSTILRSCHMRPHQPHQPWHPYHHNQ